MMEAERSAEPAQSSRSKPVTTGGFLANILRSCVQVFATAKYFLRPRYPGPAEAHAHDAAVETGAAASVPPAADMNVDTEPGINAAVSDQQEIERRRNLVRIFFNDFWSGTFDKPAAFVERLDAAEDYLNARLAANGEVWRVDAKTRVMLGLPPRSNSSVSANIDRHTSAK
jgi:hypothetical protein